MGRSTTTLNILLATLLLMLPCFVSGQPQLFPDTKAYFALGEEIAGLVPAAPAHSAAQTLRGQALPPVAAARETRLAYTVAAARSPYYSLYLYLACLIGTAWLAVALQALASAAVLWIATRAFDAGAAYIPIVAMLALATALPIYTFLA